MSAERPEDPRRRDLPRRPRPISRETGESVGNTCRVFLDFVLGNKVMVGTVNANREHFETGVEDLPAAVHEYGDWVSLLLTHPVPSLDNYEKLFENLSTGRGVIKVFCNV